MNRRHILRLAALAAGAAIAAPALHAQSAQSLPKEIRIGTQKSGFFPAARQRRIIEDAFNPQGVAVKWVEFAFGPPMLEAMNVGSVDYGYVGDSPPIFAQAGGARLLYVGAFKSRGDTQAIVVPKDSAIKTLADLRGKRIGFGKGSSAHNLVVAALEKAGIPYTDVTPVPLAPADAMAAFVKGAIDAWSIWDPYLSLAELNLNARPIVFDKDVHKPNAFLLANADFTEKYPGVVAKLNNVFAAEGVWAEEHRAEVAKVQAAATGVELAAVQRFIDRSNFRLSPVDDEVIASQQAIADRYAQLGLIPKTVDVRAIVWKWTPPS